MAALRKKAIFFTLISILVVSIIVLAFASSSSYFTLKHKVPVVKTRVQQADDYVKNLRYAYLDRALYSSSYAALNALTVYINNTNSFLTDEADLSAKFSELVIYGTINGQRITYQGKDLMMNRTFVEKLGRIEELSYSAMRITTNFSKSGYNVVLYQSNATGPWQVAVNASVGFFVDAGLASWNDSVNISTMFRFDGISDPVYIIKQEGDANKFKKSLYDAWDFGNLSSHVSNRTYKHEVQAPGFLQRFYSSFSASGCCGIESIPNIRGLNKVTVDYCYFNIACLENPPYKLYTINGLSNNIKFDAYHVASYNVEDQAVVAWTPP